MSGMFGGGGSAPTPPNPAWMTALQSGANKEAFNYALDASRVNQYSPYGSQTWGNKTNFDQTGFDKATAAWQKAVAAAPMTPDWNRYARDNPDITGSGMTPQEHYEKYGKAEGRALSNSANGMAQPLRSDFESNQWEYRQSLSPEQQKLYDADMASKLQQSTLLEGAANSVGTAMGKPIDWSSAPGLTGSVNPALLQGFAGAQPNLAKPDASGKYSADMVNQTAADAQYNSAMRYLRPEQENQQKALEARLAEQGFVPGTPGYAKAMETFQDTNNRASADARDRSTLLGAQVGGDIFNRARSQTQDANNVEQQTFQNLLTSLGFNNNVETQQQNADTNAATFGNQARAQAIAELLQQRNQPLNELNALRSGAQVNLPNNTAQYSTPNLAPTDVAGLYNNNYNQQLGNYNAGVAGKNDMFGNLLNLGGMAMGLPPGTGSMFSSLFSGGAPAGPTPAGPGMTVPPGFKW